MSCNWLSLKRCSVASSCWAPLTGSANFTRQVGLRLRQIGASDVGISLDRRHDLAPDAAGDADPGEIGLDRARFLGANVAGRRELADQRLAADALTPEASPVDASASVTSRCDAVTCSVATATAMKPAANAAVPMTSGLVNAPIIACAPYSD